MIKTTKNNKQKGSKDNIKTQKLVCDCVIRRFANTNT